MKNKILISCANGEISYDLISYLKKKYSVIGIDNNKIGLARKICDEFYLCPKGNSKEFPIFLDKISKKVDAIFLFADEEILNISKNFKKLKNIGKKILISDYSTINICNDKKKLENELRNVIRIPKFKKNKTNLIKPTVGRGSKNIIVLKDKKLIHQFTKNNKYLVQEFIKGTEYTVDCFFEKQGLLHQYVARERVVKKNVSIIGKVVKENKIKKIIDQISNKIKFKGLINFQFIKSKKNYFLIEINPRISGSIIFSIKSNFDVINLSIEHLKNKPLKKNKIKFNKFYFRYYKTFT